MCKLMKAGGIFGWDCCCIYVTVKLFSSVCTTVHNAESILTRAVQCAPCEIGKCKWELFFWIFFQVKKDRRGVTYHSVCSLVRFGSAHPLSRKRMCPPESKGGNTPRLWQRPNSDDGRESLALWLLGGKDRESSLYKPRWTEGKKRNTVMCKRILL